MNIIFTPVCHGAGDRVSGPPLLNEYREKKKVPLHSVIKPIYIITTVVS